MKKPKSGKKKNTTGAVVGVIVVLAVSAGFIYFYNQHGSVNETASWVTSGPFSITNSTFRLGDNIFMIINGLKPTDAGKIVVYDPKGTIFTQTPFNGTEKPDFNWYFKPTTDRVLKLCATQDLVGNWTIDFQGTSYRPLSFQVLNTFVPHEETEPDLQPINPC